MNKILNNKLFLLITNLTFMVSLFILNVFYQYHNFNFTLKCIGSAIFATLGLINLLFALAIISLHKFGFVGKGVGKPYFFVKIRFSPYYIQLQENRCLGKK